MSSSDDPPASDTPATLRRAAPAAPPAVPASHTGRSQVWLRVSGALPGLVGLLLVFRGLLTTRAGATI